MSKHKESDLMVLVLIETGRIKANEPAKFISSVICPQCRLGLLEKILIANEIGELSTNVNVCFECNYLEGIIHFSELEKLNHFSL